MYSSRLYGEGFGGDFFFLEEAATSWSCFCCFQHMVKKRFSHIPLGHASFPSLGYSAETSWLQCKRGKGESNSAVYFQPDFPGHVLGPYYVHTSVEPGSV